MNEGWLCNSILKAHTHPSPISMMPAFSPGPHNATAASGQPLHARAKTCQQCSLHITLKMPSSVMVGSRPAEKLFDLLVFFRREAVLANNF